MYIYMQFTNSLQLDVRVDMNFSYRSAVQFLRASFVRKYAYRKSCDSSRENVDFRNEPRAIRRADRDRYPL